MIIRSSTNEKNSQIKLSKFQKIIILLSALLFLFIFWHNHSLKSKINEWLKLKGFYATFFLEDPILYSQSIPINLLKSISSFNNLPIIAIDIKFKNWKKLEIKRNEAIAKGVLIKDEDDYVKASLRYGDKVSKVDLRLKGDQTDHLLGNKWSFRIKVLGNDRVFGLRRFSIQNPRTRLFQSEPMFYQMLKDFGIITPRYFFVQAYVNGVNIGVMAIEEHFSKEMIEYNRRKESVFIGIEENRRHARVDHYKLLYDSNFKTFQHNSVLNSKELSEDFETAISLLRSFLANELTTDKVFDEVLMGRFLALVDVWSAGHGLNENSRFYYNPINARLEPVGFDSNLGEDLNFYGNMILGKSITSSQIRLVYVETIRKIKEYLNNKEYLDKLISLDSNFETQLRKEFFLKPPPEMNKLEIIKNRIDKIEESFLKNPLIVGSFDKCNSKPFSGWAVDLGKPYLKAKINYKNKAGNLINIYADQSELGFHKLGIKELGLENDNHGFVIPNHYEGLVSHCSIKKTRSLNSKMADKRDIYYSLTDALIYKKNNQFVIEVINLTDHHVKIQSIIKDKKNIKFNFNEIPKIIPPRKKTIIYLNKNIKFDNFNNIKLISTFEDKNTEYASKVVKYAPIIYKNPAPESNLNEQLKFHSFLAIDKKNKILTVAKGTWRVNNTIIVPHGYTLEINMDTKLNFNSNSGIISYGNLSFNGDLNKPIILDSYQNNQNWVGIIVIGNHKKLLSTFKNVKIRNIKNFNKFNWRQTGSIVFYRSQVIIKNLFVENSNSEDAINIINSNFDIKNLTIKNTVSDAVDIDFSEGSLSNGNFSEIGFSGGGDAIDISGSNVNLYNIKIKKVNDKAISVGEKSNLFASNIDINNSNIGVASKDLSNVFISDSSLSNIKLSGLMAYIKKMEFGPAKINAENIKFSKTITEAIAQNESYIELNGERIPNKKFNINDLYKKQILEFVN